MINLRNLPIQIDKRVILKIPEDEVVEASGSFPLNIKGLVIDVGDGSNFTIDGHELDYAAATFPIETRGLGTVMLSNLTVTAPLVEDTPALTIGSVAKVHDCTVSGGGIGILVKHEDVEIVGCTISNSLIDTVRVHTSDVRLVNCSITQTLPKPDNLFHRDLLQLVAASNGVRTNKEQNKSSIYWITVDNCVLTSNQSDVQGIMMSDGILLASTICNNTVKVQNPHSITVNRAKDIEVADNILLSNLTIGSHKPNDNTSSNLTIERNVASQTIMLS